MAERHKSSRREWWLSVAIVFAAVLFRSAVFVFWERSHFDSDQAITGLMAKHLAEGRALPVFWYGQSYLLAVESWLAAPLFLLAGASVTALKLPVLAINVAIGLLLLRALVLDAGLRPFAALIPTMFFALPAAGTSARLVEANGGNVEPFLYVLLIWTLRFRPLWCGAIAGIGFLHREFTIYGFAALLTVEAFRGELLTRAGALRRLLAAGAAAAVWFFVQWAKQYSSAAGPGTTLADVYQPHHNIVELTERFCFDPQTAAIGIRRLVTEHWPVLFGTLVEPLRDFGIVSQVSQGTAWSGALLVLIVLAGLAGISLVERKWSVSPFCAFLVCTAVYSCAGYVLGRCGALDFYFLRYELLSILGVAGIAAAFLKESQYAPLRVGWLGLVAIWFLLTIGPHARLYLEYLRTPPPDVRRTLIEHLDARGARYASAGYWVAYALTFLTDERIIVKSDDFVRIREYQRVVDEHAYEAIRISRTPCPDGEEVIPRVFFCGPR